MKTVEKVRNRIKEYIKGKRKKRPVIQIAGRDPWNGQKWVKVPVPSDVRKLVDYS